MDENPSHKAPLEEKAFCSLLVLKRALVGDLECVELLELLEQRIAAINWDDAAFIESTLQLSAGIPPLSPEVEASARPDLLDLLHHLMEQFNQNNENDAARGPALKDAIQRLSEACGRAKSTEAYFHRLAALVEKMISLHAKMRDRLKMLGSDVSEFETPKL
jgi:hypothetical protein